MGGRREQEASFKEAFVALYPQAVRVAYRIVGDRPQAQDVASEALARAFAQWAKVGELPHREAWVLRVATNLALDTVRRRQVVVEAGPAPSREDAVATRLALVAALRELSDRQREAVVLRYLSDWSEDDVASALGVEPGTVKTHLRRGLESLRRHLGDDFEGVALAV